MNPRESALPRPVAMRLAASEYDRCAEMFRSLRPAQGTQLAPGLAVYRFERAG